MTTYREKTTSIRTLRHGKHKLILSSYRYHTLIFDSARITSAAPIYFKPFYHRRTRRTYVDGVLQRNNPIRVADEERRLIWREDKKHTDIIVSLGSGKYTQYHGGVKQAKTSNLRFKNILPGGLRANVATIYDMVLSTLDCEREWNDFVGSYREDDRFIGVCHRLDIGLEKKPPKIDAVDEIPALEREARDYLHQRRNQRYRPYLNPEYSCAYAHIRVVARRLLATLFYFDSTETIMTNQPVHKCVGFLQCRLSPTMDAQFSSLMASGPNFRERQGTQTRNISFLHPNISSSHFDRTTFSSKIEFVIETPGSPPWIEVCFPIKSDKWEPISGF